MKTILILIISFVAVYIFFELNAQYKWINFTLDWVDISIAVAAAGGPLQYIRKKVNEMQAEKAETEFALTNRTISHEEFMQRENYNSGLRTETKQTKKESEKEDDDFSIQGNVYG